MSQEDNVRPTKFSSGRLIIFMGLALVVFRSLGGTESKSALLFGAGTLLLALFASVFDPLAPTDIRFKPSNPTEWAAAAAMILGLCLITAGLFTVIG